MWSLALHHVNVLVNDKVLLQQAQNCYGLFDLIEHVLPSGPFFPRQQAIVTVMLDATL